MANNFYLPFGYSYFNFAIYGGGGNGSNPLSIVSSGGGGAGAYIKSIQIPYSSSGATITNIKYGISGGGQYVNNTYIVVNYDNSTSINLNAGQGKTTINGQGSTGSLGGIYSISNTTTFYDSTNNTMSYNGESGGNEGNNGTINGYTSSGSGSNGGTSSPVGNPSTASITYNVPDNKTYVITSSGGGTSQIVSGYGAGGAATPSSYNKNAPAYRTGSVGCILYWLS